MDLSAAGQAILLAALAYAVWSTRTPPWASNETATGPPPPASVRLPPGFYRPCCRDAGLRFLLPGADPVDNVGRITLLSWVSPMVAWIWVGGCFMALG